MRNSRARVLFGLVAAVLIQGGCAAFSSEEIEDLEPAKVAVSDGWLAMGTFFEADLRVAAADVPRARAFLDWARTEVSRLEGILSRYDSASELSSLNRELAGSASVGRGFALSEDLEAALFVALEVWEASGGGFDVTVGPLIHLWQAAAERGTWPSVENLRRVRRRVGSEGLLLLGDGRFEVTTPGLRIDLDGLAKGFALDKIREAVRERFPEAAALFSFGQSSLVAIGDPDTADPSRERGWNLEIRSRGPSGEVLGSIRLLDRALSVSSSLGSVREIGDQQVSHVVDPRTGGVVEGTVEAVVVGDRAALVDGFSTALLVLGADRGSLRLAEKAGLEAIVFGEGGRTAETEGYEALAEAARR